jgi:hypothetical protein
MNFSPVSAYERASLGLRQTTSDLECAQLHLQNILFHAGELPEHLVTDLHILKGQIAMVLQTAQECHQAVFQTWKSTNP